MLLRLKEPSSEVIEVVNDLPVCPRLSLSSLTVMVVPVTKGPFCTLPVKEKVVFAVSFVQETKASIPKSVKLSARILVFIIICF
jgi:hypothetical protein